MKYLGILFIWMKYYYIAKNSLLYKKIETLNIKYLWCFYLLTLFYPIWIIIGLFTGNIIYPILLGLYLCRYIIYPFLKGKLYKYYELIESIISIILYIILCFK